MYFVHWEYHLGAKYDYLGVRSDGTNLIIGLAFWMNDTSVIDQKVLAIWFNSEHQKTVLLKPAQVFHSSLQHDWLRVQQFKVLGMQRYHTGGENTNSGRFTFALSPSATCFLPWCPSSNSQLFKQTKWNIVNVDAFHNRVYKHAIMLDVPFVHNTCRSTNMQSRLP